ncbi:MAG: tetratricopeptide repeat protein [Ignavibacteriales bacterium]|jgi:cytochrome c-type biogenesis protein CcmH/NrfG|nr:tetratricopeptide repeat protein [Ignavibacteriales bacterium]MBK7266201.1 tetratricopeptide repeat protein [Ignavibacteriales bacterium]MBK8664110.1 tetratricopeptide repeat protein [Ignavibacteriales bacterium]MBP7542903.1 tetratricopeptide repeat protein [Ignavibacteriaceae bacterium]MBP9121969.1 tetratricopeptide repeat protein [Ignavibacteriaceae bacterium]
MAEQNKMISCPICGAENSATAAYCSDCGALLNPEMKKKAGKQANAGTGTGNKQSKRGVKSGSNPEKTALVTLIVFVVLALIALISSGVFDSPSEIDAHAGHNHPPGQHDAPQNQLGSGTQINTDIMNMEKQLSENPDNLELKLQLAHAYFDAGNFEKAIPLYKDYLVKKPGVPDVLVDLGVCFFNKNDLTQAEDYFKQALTADPKHQIAHLNMGVVNLTNNKMDIANDWLTKAIAIDPNSNAAKQAQNLIEKNKK